MYSLVTEDSGPRISFCSLRLFQKISSKNCFSKKKIIPASHPSHRLPTESAGCEAGCDSGLYMAHWTGRWEKTRVLQSDQRDGDRRKPEGGLGAFFCLFPFLTVLTFPPLSRFSYQWSNSLWFVLSFYVLAEESLFQEIMELFLLVFLSLHEETILCREIRMWR